MAFTLGSVPLFATEYNYQNGHSNLMQCESLVPLACCFKLGSFHTYRLSSLICVCETGTASIRVLHWSETRGSRSALLYTDLK